MTDPEPYPSTPSTAQMPQVSVPAADQSMGGAHRSLPIEYTAPASVAMQPVFLPQHQKHWLARLLGALRHVTAWPAMRDGRKADEP